MARDSTGTLQQNPRTSDVDDEINKDHINALEFKFALDSAQKLAIENKELKEELNKLQASQFPILFSFPILIISIFFIRIY